MMMSGSVRTVSSGFSTAFAIPSTAEPIRYAAQPWIWTPSHIAVAAQRAARLIPQAITRRGAKDMATVYKDSVFARLHASQTTREQHDLGLELVSDQLLPWLRDSSGFRGLTRLWSP